jgi:hypothetical protein
MDKPEKFNSLFDAIQSASYLDTLRHAEYQWIQSRLSWLFISQSFCITTYTVLSIAMTERSLESRQISILKLGLPVFGVISCVLVGVAVLAAAGVARRLAVERQSALRFINENTPINVPEAGRGGDPALRGWTYWAGELPHRVLPWILAAFWLLQFAG